MTVTRSVRAEVSRNERGSAEDRRRRRAWLVKTYAADVPQVWSNVSLAWLPACRCYRCGELLTVDNVTVDRIIPGCKGGTYRRNNIRPACFDCNRETGQQYRR